MNDRTRRTPGSIEGTTGEGRAAKLAGLRPPRAAFSMDTRDPRGVLDEETLAAMWRAFFADHGRAARQRLVRHYVETLVRRIARRVVARLPGEVEEEDLVQEGAIALDRAIDRYRTDRNTRFDTFATKHVSGAMLDSLRRNDPASRLARKRERMVREACERFRVLHGRMPSDDELRTVLQLSEDEFALVVRDARVPGRVRLPGENADAREDEGSAIDGLPDRGAGRPVDDVRLDDLRRFITRGLSREDRLMVLLYYAEDLTMADIAGVLGISESRVSQKMKNLREIVRRRLAESEGYREVAG